MYLFYCGPVVIINVLVENNNIVCTLLLACTRFLFTDITNSTPTTPGQEGTQIILSHEPAAKLRFYH